MALFCSSVTVPLCTKTCSQIRDWMSGCSGRTWEAVPQTHPTLLRWAQTNVSASRSFSISKCPCRWMDTQSHRPTPTSSEVFPEAWELLQLLWQLQSGRENKADYTVMWLHSGDEGMRWFHSSSHFWIYYFEYILWSCHAHKQVRSRKVAYHLMQME